MLHAPELTYDPEADMAVFLSGSLEVGDDTYTVSAATTAGRSLPESPCKPNEDTFGIVHDESNIALAVFDGASSQKIIPELTCSGARYASHSLKEDFDFHTAVSLAEPKVALSSLNSMFRHRFRRLPSVDYADANSLPTATATIARINTESGRLDIAHVGDSWAAALFEDGDTALLTNDLHRPFDEQVLRLIHQIAVETGTTPREARDDPRVRTAIMQMFQDVRNRPDGTGEGMVNGDPHMDQYIHTASLPLEGVRAVLLASDGLVPPGMDERLHGHRKKLFDVAIDGGIAAVIALAKSRQDSDPDRWHLRYKHGDDATGILLQK
jgi:serine/threonine protein phosphatase PrpC